jgi:tetratricopeptide (TPR) repeat protein
MRVHVRALLTITAVFWAALAISAGATGTEPAADPQVDPALCVAAIAANDDDRIMAACGALIDNQKTARGDRIKALMARAAVFSRRNQVDRAIADYDAVVLLDASLADVYNNRGELWRKAGDRRKALADFDAALKRNPDLVAARTNYKDLVLELERLGALIAVYNKPSFNCAKARRPVEKTICADPALANLDREITAVNAKVIERARAGNPQAVRALQREQDAFVARRNAVFGQADFDLLKAMRARLDRLLAIERAM